MPPDIGVKKSPLVFMLTDDHSEPSGLTLVSTDEGHIIEISDKYIKYYQKLNLRYVVLYFGFQGKSGQYFCEMIKSEN